MTARQLYNEDQIIAALNEASRKNGIFPATGTFLKELRGRGEVVMPVRYTEQEIRNAWNEVIRRTTFTPSYEFERRFFEMLAATKPKEKPVLFTRDDLLAVASTVQEKWMVHGIFAMLGTAAANDNALLAQAGIANMRSNMQIMIGLAKARKEEDFQPGQVVRDANGSYFKLMDNRRWAVFEHAMFLDFDRPRRPLEKMP